MRKTLVVLLALALLGSAPSALAQAPDENPTIITKAAGFLETLVSWLGFSVTEEPEDGSEAPPVVAPDGDGHASEAPETGGEIGAGFDPEG